MPEADQYRLPQSVVPQRYELTLTPDLENATFAGEVNIRIDVLEATNEIVLNAAELEIFDVEVTSDAGNRIASSVRLDQQLERAHISLEELVVPGAWTLHLTFAGLLNDQLRGFYKSTFQDESGTRRSIATTQFEATDARRAFPCWDEPEFKAVFAITLIVDDELFAVSNARIVEETRLGNGKRQVEFADTIKMSTYILAFIVGPFSATETVDVDGVPMRVICVPGREHLTSFALEAGAASLRFFVDYFGIPYPGDKVDMIAIPDFAAGAMENLGCITFRETALLVDTERASKTQIERVAEVIGHEMAHMWFGDLVTMKWWNGLWLNEAFANFMESLFVDDFHPEWERWVGISAVTANALGTDSLHTTRPIEFEVTSPDDADEMFDVLTYYKGGAVLRMLEQHIGPEVFRRGVSEYLKKHAYGNAETTDLWDALDSVSDQPVRTLMDSWIFQAGHPVVHVESHNATTLEFSQRRSLYLDDGSDSTRWSVPVAIRTEIDGTMHSQKLLLTDTKATVELAGKPSWIVANAGSTGFYPVSYSPDFFRQLTSNIANLDALERFAVINNAWNACLAGRVALQDVMSIIELMKEDRDPDVWRALLIPIRAIDHLTTDEYRDAVQRLAHRVSTPNFGRLGWEPTPGEPERTGVLRSVVIGARGGLGADETIREQSLERFRKYLDDSSSLSADLVTVVQMVGATTNDRDFYELLRARIGDSTIPPQDAVVALQALASFTDPALVEQTLGMLLSEVRSQDAPYALITLIARHETGNRAWEWLENNWDEALERFPNNSIDRLVGGLTERFDPEFLQRADNFLEAHPVSFAAKAIAQTRERLQVNRRFYERNVDEVRHLLTQ